MNDEQRQDIMDAAVALAEGRVRYARAYLMNKVSTDGMPVTDKTAEQRTIETTGDELTLLEVKLQLALMEGTNR